MTMQKCKISRQMDKMQNNYQDDVMNEKDAKMKELDG